MRKVVFTMKNKDGQNVNMLYEKQDFILEYVTDLSNTPVKYFAELAQDAKRHGCTIEVINYRN